MNAVLNLGAATNRGDLATNQPTCATSELMRGI